MCQKESNGSRLAISPFHASVKIKVKDSSSTSELSHQNIGLCDDHIECNPVSRVTVRMYARIVCEIAEDGGVTICARKSERAAGFEIIDSYAENLGEWGDCCICTVTDILLGPCALPLILGLLVIGKSSVYRKCLNDMRLHLVEEQIKELGGVFKELAGIHLKYMERDGI